MTTNPTLAQADQDAIHYRGILHTLIDQGAALAARIHATATAATTPDSALPEAASAFDRAARAVRRTIALARHIAAHPIEAPAAQPTRATTRARLIRGVEDAIHARHRQTGAESLYAEFAERLEDPELELDLAGRSVDEVIEEICRDLGVAQQGHSYVWRRRTPRDIASLHERAAAPPGPASLHLVQGGRPTPLQSHARGGSVAVPDATAANAPLHPDPPPRHGFTPPRP